MFGEKDKYSSDDEYDKKILSAYKTIIVSLIFGFLSFLFFIFLIFRIFSSCDSVRLNEYKWQAISSEVHYNYKEDNDEEDKIGDVILKKITAEVTAYSEIDSCHTGESCLMASGKKAYVGAIACPRHIRFGTRVFIDNVLYICEDRASLKYPKRFDIFMGYGQDSYNKAIIYGKKIKEIRLEQGGNI